MIRVHLKGTFAPSHHAAAYWREQSKAGEPVDARLINTTSVSGLYANVGQTNYGAAKAGIAAFTQIAAQELARYGVTVNAIAPGALTRLTGDLEMTDEIRQQLRADLGRAGDHVARIARLRRRHRTGDRGVGPRARRRRGLAPGPVDRRRWNRPTRSARSCASCWPTPDPARSSTRSADVGDAWIVDVVRTPRGKGRPDGGLHDVHPQELLAQCLRRCRPRVGFDPAEVDDVVAGNGILSGDHDAVGRLAHARWPAGPRPSPVMTLNRFCGSAQQAITVAAMGVASGHQDLVVAGGVESMSRWDLAVGSATIDGDNPDFRARFPTVPQGISADLIATLEGFARTDVDAFAVESQRRAERRSPKVGSTAGSSPSTGADGEVLLAADEHPAAGHDRRGAGEAACRIRGGRGDLRRRRRCERYPEVDAIEHVHHAGNSSGVVDGAAAALVASDGWVRAHGVTPRAGARHCGHRLGAGDHADGPGPCRRAVPGQGRDDGRRRRPVGGQRGVRRGADEDDPRPPPRRGSGERQRWGDRARSPDRRDRRHARRHAPRRARAARPQRSGWSRCAPAEGWARPR